MIVMRKAESSIIEFLSVSQAEHFPITGSFPKPPFMYGSGDPDKSRNGTSNADERKPRSLEFNFHAKAASLSGFTSFTIPAALKQNQPFGQIQDQLISGIQLSSSDQKESLFSVATDRSSDDGYNWRKYGQKLVKGSEFPRSYYKCTYPSCEVRKIFESFPSGQITEIFYKGSHDHPKPACRRLNPSVLTSIQEEKFSEDFAFAGQDDKPDIEGIELKSPAWSPPQASKDDADCSHPQIQIINIDEDDIFSKRRKVEREFDFAPLAKPIREPRIVVHTVSEIAVLDDGYRWRKYGQKVVRGNLNPRSYYKCTNPGCPVRKHVERAPHDLNAVLTTYEGKHSHDVPIAKNNSHEISRTSSRVLSPMKLTSEHSGSISLDLGVGISLAALSQTNE